MCTALDLQCGSITAVDRCGASRTVTSCGSCSGDTACGANRLLGHCSVPATVAPQTPGTAVPLWPQYFADDIFAIQATGAAWATVTAPTTYVAYIDGWAYSGALWFLTSPDLSRTILYSFDGSTWQERRAWNDYRKMVGGIDSAGVLTLHQDSDGSALLERWQDSGPTSVATVANGKVDASLLTVLAMPTSTSVLHGNRPLYLTRF